MAKPASKGVMVCSELDWDANYKVYVRQCKSWRAKNCQTT